MIDQFKHYVILVIILALGSYAFLLAAPNVTNQLLVGIGTAVFYVIWGITYHAGRKDLHQKIVIEYILVALISIVLLITVLGF